MEDMTTTIKIKDLPKFNELDWAQWKYDTALKAMLNSPTKENQQTFAEANRYLYEIQDKYRIGKKLLIQFRKDHPITRRNYIPYNETKQIQIRR